MIIDYNRRKFRSQTSDNMDRWKAEVVRVKEEKRREEKKKEDQKENYSIIIITYCTKWSLIIIINSI